MWSISSGQVTGRLTEGASGLTATTMSRRLSRGGALRVMVGCMSAVGAVLANLRIALAYLGGAGAKVVDLERPRFWRRREETLFEHLTPPGWASASARAFWG